MAARLEITTPPGEPLPRLLICTPHDRWSDDPEVVYGDCPDCRAERAAQPVELPDDYDAHDPATSPYVDTEHPLPAADLAKPLQRHGPRRRYYQPGTGIVSSNPRILGGSLVFSGTRVPIRTLLDHLDAGDGLEDFLDQFPSVSREQAVALADEAFMWRVRDEAWKERDEALRREFRAPQDAHRGRSGRPGE